MNKVLAWGLVASVIFASNGLAQTTCKRFTVSSSQGCSWCGFGNPFQHFKTVTYNYHFVCSDGSDTYSTQTNNYACGTC